MADQQGIRAGEVQVTPPPATDAGLVYIGRIHTPWSDRRECPRQGRGDGPTCRIEIFDPWVAALDTVAEFKQLEVLYWLHLARRDLVRQSPASDGNTRGTFGIRSPVRPNPIGSAVVTLVRLDGRMLFVRGLDCVDDTPLLDIKPERGLHKPLAPSQPGDFQVGDN